MKLMSAVTVPVVPAIPNPKFIRRHMGRDVFPEYRARRALSVHTCFLSTEPS